MTTVYHLQPSSFEYAEFYKKPLPHWLVCLADAASGPIQHLLLAMVLPDGTNRSTDCVGEIVEMRGREQAFPG